MSVPIQLNLMNDFVFVIGTPCHEAIKHDPEEFVNPLDCPLILLGSKG